MIPAKPCGLCAIAAIGAILATAFFATPAVKKGDLPATATRLQGHAIPAPKSLPLSPIGRIGPITPAPTLSTWEPGTTIHIPLPDGTTHTGKVNLSMRDTHGWTRVGGELSGGGSFSFSERGTSLSGLVQLPHEATAWRLQPQPDGRAQYKKLALSSVRCSALPRPLYEREEPMPNETELRAPPPILSSRPGANAVLFLDFDGETVSDPNWANGQVIEAPKARMNARQISKVFDRVAGDFIAFDVDVTTNPSRYANAALGSRMRCIITRNDKAAPRSGGVAYVGSFADAGTGDFTNNIPCWVFIDRNADLCAEAISHELGHTLGLDHDGRDFQNGRHQEYYGGQGRGRTGWTPIMGVSYYRRLSQWSKGEYRNASNTEDDIGIIAGANNGFGFIPDDAGNTPGTANNLAGSGPIVDQRGVIRNVNDMDVFRLQTSGGRAAINLKADGPEGNVDLSVELLDSAGNPLLNENPRNSLNASFRKNLSPGTYYLRIRGTGKGDPARTGYSAYGSIGSYRIVGKVNGLNATFNGGG
jgi:hypothetical protein